MICSLFTRFFLTYSLYIQTIFHFLKFSKYFPSKMMKNVYLKDVFPTHAPLALLVHLYPFCLCLQLAICFFASHPAAHMVINEALNRA